MSKHTIIWAGTPPEDTPFWEAPSFQKPVWVVYGEQDTIVTPERMLEKVKWLDRNKLEIKELMYSGKHRVTQSVIKNLLNRIKN